VNRGHAPRIVHALPFVPVLKAIVTTPRIVRKGSYTSDPVATEPDVLRAEDLRRWRASFPDVTAIAELAPRHPAVCVGVVHKIRLVPGRALEVTVEDGTGRVTAVFDGRATLPGLELGAGLRLCGTLAQDADGTRRLRNPSWELVAEPYA
jgi:hypothetical protein